MDFLLECIGAQNSLKLSPSPTLLSHPFIWWTSVNESCNHCKREFILSKHHDNHWQCHASLSASSIWVSLAAKLSMEISTLLFICHFHSWFRVKCGMNKLHVMLCHSWTENNIQQFKHDKENCFANSPSRTIAMPFLGPSKPFHQWKCASKVFKYSKWLKDNCASRSRNPINVDLRLPQNVKVFSCWESRTFAYISIHHASSRDGK